MCVCVCVCVCMCVLVARLCLTLCDPMDYSWPDSPFYGIIQARILEWVVIPFSRGSAAAAAKSLQSCPTLCDPIDGSPPGSPVPGILQARTLEWDAISFSSAWKWKVKVKSLSRVQLFTTPWTEGYQAPPSMGFSRLEYWSGLPLPSPLEDLPNPIIKPESPALAGRFFTTLLPRKAHLSFIPTWKEKYKWNDW